MRELTEKEKAIAAGAALIAFGKAMQEVGAKAIKNAVEKPLRKKPWK